MPHPYNFRERRGCALLQTACARNPDMMSEVLAEESERQENPAPSRSSTLGSPGNSTRTSVDIQAGEPSSHPSNLSNVLLQGATSSQTDPRAPSQPVSGSDQNTASTTLSLVTLFLETVSRIQREENEGVHQGFLMPLTRNTLSKAGKHLNKLDLGLSGSRKGSSKSVVMELTRRLPHFLSTLSREALTCYPKGMMAEPNTVLLRRYLRTEYSRTEIRPLFFTPLIFHLTTETTTSQIFDKACKSFIRGKPRPYLFCTQIGRSGRGWIMGMYIHLSSWLAAVCAEIEFSPSNTSAENILMNIKPVPGSSRNGERMVLLSKPLMELEIWYRKHINARVISLLLIITWAAYAGKRKRATDEMLHNVNPRWRRRDCTVLCADHLVTWKNFSSRFFCEREFHKPTIFCSFLCFDPSHSCVSWQD